jgi:hypothetical protein
MISSPDWARFARNFSIDDRFALQVALKRRSVSKTTQTSQRQTDMRSRQNQTTPVPRGWQASAAWLLGACMLGQVQHAKADTIIGDVLCRQPVAGSPNVFLFTLGYESFGASPVLLLPGPQNFFSPGPGNLGQLTTFYPGRHPKAFRIPFDFSLQDTFSWSLQSKQYLISKRSPRCSPETAPQPAAPVPLPVAPMRAAGGVQTALLENIVAALTCIEIIPGGYRAVFGYESFERSPVLIASGASNNIAPATAPQRQLTTLYPGYFPRAFRIDVTAVAPALAGNITWNFLGQARQASLNSPICLSETRPPPAGTLSVESGGGQSAAINTPFPQVIRIKVLLSGGAVEGVILRATAPASGASASFVSATASTDSAGIATFSARANGTTGAYSISITRTTEAPGPSISVGLVNQ